MKKINRIFVLGHAGAGKSVLANALAKKLGWKVINADFGLEYSIGLNLEQILGSEGCNSFHQRETEILANMMGKNNIVINTDSAIIDNDKNRKLLSDEFAVFVNVSTPVQLERLAKNQDPLLPVNDMESFLNKLHIERDEHFDEVADFSFSSDDGELDKHVESIINAMP